MHIFAILYALFKVLRLVYFIAEIPDFLSDSEIEFMVGKAKQQFMDEGGAESGLSEKSEYVKTAGILEYFHFN